MTVLKIKNSTLTTPPSSLEIGELALCTLAGSEKLYTKNSNNAIVDLLNKSGLATYTYVDNTFLKKSGGVMTGGLTVPSIINNGIYRNGILDTHGEGNTVMIPFVFNDIAHLDKRGGSIETNYGSIPTSVVDGGAIYINYAPSALTANVPSGLTITFNLHKTFYWGNKIGVSFGSTPFRSKYIKIEVYQNNISDWVTIDEIGNNSESIYQLSYSNGSSGISKLRFTFNDYVTNSDSGFRIAGIWLYNYNSNGMKEICVGRDGGEMFGSLYPYATASNLDLGTSSKKWNNIYANNFNGALVGNASTATKLATTRTIWGQNFDGTGNVSGNLTGVETISASGKLTVSAGGISVAGVNRTGNIFTDVTGGTVLSGVNTGDQDLSNLSTYTYVDTTFVPKTRTISAGSGLSGGGSLSGNITLSHADTSSAISLTTTNTGFNVIQNATIALDTYGHVTSTSNSSINLDDYFVKITGDTMTGSLYVNNSTNSTNTTTGAIRTAGGLGVAGNIYAGGKIRTINDVICAGEGEDNSYGYINVTRPSGTTNASCFSWVRQNITAFGLGYNTSNQIVMGGAIIGRTISPWITIGNGSLSSNGYISGSRFYAGYDSGVANSINCSGWFRSNGSTGWINSTQNAGIYSDYTNIVRTYSTNKFRVFNTESDSIRTEGGLLASGNITAQGELTAYVASDRNLKKNIKPINNALDVINKLEAVSYNWNNKAKKLNENKTDQKDFGLIAQDVEAIVPEIVHNIHNEEYKAIDYIKLIPFLIKSVQELSEKVEKQQEIIKQLQNN